MEHVVGQPHNQPVGNWANSLEGGPTQWCDTMELLLPDIFEREQCTGSTIKILVVVEGHFDQIFLKCTYSFSSVIS